jgi:transcriptional regulator with XRE-family HTH domain
MPERHRSQRSRRAALVTQLRDDGWTWLQIATRIAEGEHLNMRVAFRLAHGWSQAHVAQQWNERWPGRQSRAGVTDKTISYWETWPQSGHEPSLRTLKRLAQLYHCDVGDLIEDGKYGHLDERQQAGTPERTGLALPAGTRSARRPLSAPQPGEVAEDFAPLSLVLGGSLSAGVAGRWPVPPEKLWQLAGEQGGSLLQREAFYGRLVQFLAMWADTVKRRELLRILGWAATAAAAAPLFPGLDSEGQERVVGMLASHHRVDAPVIGHIESVLWSAMRQDDALGPQAALDTVLAQRNLVRAVLPDCPADLRCRLLSLFSNLSRFAGWLSFDLSDFDSACFYYEQARGAAHEAENTELGTFVLCNMSHLATWRGQPRVGIDHAVAAQGWARQTGDVLLRAYAADVAARAYATAGMQRQCLEALASIPSDLDMTARTPATSLVYFYGYGQYADTRAQCLLSLHDAPGAVRAAQQALAGIDASFTRNQAFSTLHLGNAYIESGEIAEAARVIGDGAELAVRNRSARVVSVLLDARARLGRWQDTKAVKAMDERMASYGWGRSTT